MTAKISWTVEGGLLYHSCRAYLLSDDPIGIRGLRRERRSESLESLSSTSVSVENVTSSFIVHRTEQSLLHLLEMRISTTLLVAVVGYFPENEIKS